METILSIIATIVSSIALIGVAVSILLQNKQLRANQMQVVRDLHLELAKIAIENPNVAVAPGAQTSIEELPFHAYLNLQITLWLAAFSLKDITREGVAMQ